MRNTSKIQKILIIIGVTVGILFITKDVLNGLNPVWWQDIKLQSTRYWGLTTLDNNPLLPSYDKDISADAFDDVRPPRVNLDDLLSGGPGQDEIPSVDDPQFVPIAESEFDDDELIIGVVHDGVAKAYPYAILNWHEIVNDRIGELSVAVTYCPLCETNSVFVRELDGEQIEFGVSGKLYQSCLVMYDRKTDSLFSQVWGLGILGEKTNHVLERIPAMRTTMGQFKTQYPDALSMTTETGHNRNYSGYPYGSYYTNDNLIFPARNQDQLTEHPKEITQIVFRHDEHAPLDKFSGCHVSFTQKEARAKGEIEFACLTEEELSRPVAYAPSKAVWNDVLGTIDFFDSEGDVIPNMALFNFVLPAYFK